MGHNIMIESTIPSGVMRTLSKEEHDEYRRPFLEPGASRRAIYAFVSSVPVDGEPAEVYKMQSDSLAWMKTTTMPILLIRGNPGSSTTAEEVAMVRGFQNVTEEEVKGKHLLTEDSPREIGNAITKWYGALTSKMWSSGNGLLLSVGVKSCLLRQWAKACRCFPRTHADML